MSEPATGNEVALSLIVPVYFEEECINEFIDEISKHLNGTYDWEVVFIDDGSRDSTVELIKARARTESRIKLLVLSYNHGKEAAFTAGVNYARGELLLYMDPDLQDPPAEISRFVEKIQQGYDLVLGTRKQRKDSLLTRAFSWLFWAILDRFTDLNLPRPLAVMRIFNRRFANQFLQYKETNRFIEGLFMKVGLNWTSIEIEHRERFAGVSKFTFKRKLGLALRAILDYSDLPIVIATKFGALLVALGFSGSLVIVLLKLWNFSYQIGWPSLFVALMIGFGLQIFFMGLIGAYVGRAYLETKQRPLFSIKEFVNCSPK